MNRAKKMFTFIFLFILSILIISCKQESLDSEKAFTSATVEELGQMNRDFAKALKAKDAVAAAILYDENASILPPNEQIVNGRANIQAYWQGAIDAGLIDASVKTIDARSDGDLGYEIGTFTLRFQGTKNDTIVETGKYTEILKRDSEAKWISIYGMWSSNDPMPAK